MHIFYGIVLIIIGFIVTVQKIKQYRAGITTGLSFDYRMFVAGLGAIAIGIALVVNP